MLKLPRIATLMALLVTMALTGCTGGSYSILVGHIGSGRNSISGEYSSFSGTYGKDVKLEAGHTVLFHLATTTTKGEFAARMVDRSGNVLADIVDGTSVPISTTGSYKVQAYGEGHQGSFVLSWQIE